MIAGMSELAEIVKSPVYCFCQPDGFDTLSLNKERTCAVFEHLGMYVMFI